METNYPDAGTPLYEKPYNKYTIAGVIFSFLLLFTIIFLLSPALQKIFSVHTSVDRAVLYTSRLLIWASLGIIWLYSIKVEKRSFLPWQERRYSFLHALVSVLAVMGIVLIGCMIINIILYLTGNLVESEKFTQLIRLFKKDKFLLVFTALTAGIVEELIFRGYIQPRLQNISGKPWVGIAVSSLLFGLLHCGYGTLVNVLGPIFIGVVFSCYYYKYRNLKVIIIVHFLWDLSVLLLQIRK